MSDERLRQLGRVWEQGRAEDDGRRYAAELVRAGLGATREGLEVRLAVAELTRPQVELAAHVGHAPARELLGAPPKQELLLWARGLFRFGQAACVRAALAGARAALARWEPDHAGDRAPREALEAAEAWLACPCRTHHDAGERWNGRAGLPVWALETVTASHCAPVGHDHHALALASAAELVGEPEVKAIVRDALVPWCLDPAPADWGTPPGAQVDRKRR